MPGYNDIFPGGGNGGRNNNNANSLVRVVGYHIGLPDSFMRLHWRNWRANEQNGVFGLDERVRQTTNEFALFFR